MKRLVLLIGILIFLLSACGASGDIEVHEPWARPTVQGNNAAVYLIIHNHSKVSDELIGASSNLSDNVEIHKTTMENDIMKMQMVSSVPLNAGDEVTFAPGGYHIMLVSVKKELKMGDHVGVILHFKNHADIVVNATVGDAPADNGMDNMDN
jgi:copper(I)-binding protein